MFTCKHCNRQSEMFEVYKHIPQRRCVHCLQKMMELKQWDFTSHLINCTFINKKRCPELRGILGQKDWIAPHLIKRSKIPRNKLTMGRLKEMWTQYLWDPDQILALDENYKLVKRQGCSAAGVAKVLDVPLVEYFDVGTTFELVHADRFGQSRVLETGCSQQSIEVCA